MIRLILLAFLLSAPLEASDVDLSECHLMMMAKEEAHDLAEKILFTSSQDWEAAPWPSSCIKNNPYLDDIYYFLNTPDWQPPGDSFCRPCWDEENMVPSNYFKLDIRKKLNSLDPRFVPNLNTLGYALRTLLFEKGVEAYYSEEFRGWELADYWATIEAIYLSPEDLFLLLS